jgi:hypothetical protein
MRDLLRRSSPGKSRWARRALGTTAVAAAALVFAVPAVANAATPPNLVPLPGGFTQFWTSDGANDLHGSVVNASVLKRNDMLAVWINNNATAAQRFHAMQDSEYNNATNTAYDQSLTISTALGSVLGPLYVKGTESGKLPLVQKLINSSNGTTGAFVSTSAAKAAYSYPRPYLATDPTAAPV